MGQGSRRREFPAGPGGKLFEATKELGRFIFTLSPIPLTAFRNQSPATANQASKATLKAALDDFLSDPAIARKSRYHYFPSYEIVFHLFDNPFLPDNTHVRPEVAKTVVNTFSKLYTDLLVEEVGVSDEDSHVRALQEQVRVLQASLEAKERVIRELDQAARERLEVIHRQVASLRVQRPMWPLRVAQVIQNRISMRREAHSPSRSV